MASTQRKVSESSETAKLATSVFDWTDADEDTDGDLGRMSSFNPDTSRRTKKPSMDEVVDLPEAAKTEPPLKPSVEISEPKVEEESDQKVAQVSPLPKEQSIPVDINEGKIEEDKPKVEEPIAVKPTVVQSPPVAAVAPSPVPVAVAVALAVTPVKVDEKQPIEVKPGIGVIVRPVVQQPPTPAVEVHQEIPTSVALTLTQQTPVPVAQQHAPVTIPETRGIGCIVRNPQYTQAQTNKVRAQVQVQQPTPVSFVAKASFPAQPQPRQVSQPTVLPPRQAPVRGQFQQMANMPRIQLATSQGVGLVQLPTHPIPPNEIRTTKQILLEQKTSAPQIAIPSTSPKTTSISLPTQPVPISTALTVISSASNVPRSVASAIPLLPNQPLPITAAQQLVASSKMSTTSVVTAPNMSSPPISIFNSLPASITSSGQIAIARLPQHPVPMTSESEPTPPAQVTTHVVVAPKKREILVVAKEQQELLKKQEEDQSAVVSIQPKAQVHLKPRDAFGGGSHLRLHEEASLKEDRFAHQPKYVQPPVSSPSYVPSEHAMLLARQEAVNQEIHILFQHLVSKGHPESQALLIAQQIAQERFAQLDVYRPPAAHTPDTYGRQAESPMIPAHAHSSIPSTSPYVVLPPGAHDSYLHRPEERISYPPSIHQPISLARVDMPPSTALEQITDYNTALLDSYPVVWQGFLGLKNEFATVQFHYVSGCKDLARLSLPQSVQMPSSAGDDLQEIQMPTLRIGQRMRLEPCQLGGVQRKMLQPQEHCILLALPCGKDNQDVEIQSHQLRSHFITYLQLKGAAGIINISVPESGDQAAYVVHVFPSCDFANETMSGIAPDLLARVAEIEHMVIIIATVFDNK